MSFRALALSGLVLLGVACGPANEMPSPTGGSGGSGGGDTACTPGEPVACACPGSAPGTAPCAADGTPGSCTCGDGGNGGAPQGGAGSGGNGGAGGTGGAGGSGGAGLCTPRSTQICYSGPAGTEGVGACKAGVATCLPDGSAYGECIGQKVPAPEQCGGPVDEDCDGLVNEEGDGCACVPGDQKPCYYLYDGTEGVGACKPGAQTCDESGEHWGWCDDATYPHAEDCTTPEDEDCDGTPGPCAAVAWSRRFGDAGTQHSVKVAADAAGKVVLGAVYYGTLDFGGGPLPSAGGIDVAVARLDENGDHLWSKRFGTSAGEALTDLATDSQSNVILAIRTESPLDLGGGLLPAGGGEDVVIAKLDANGNHVWSKRFSTPGDEILWSVAVTSSDDIVLFGNGGSLTSLSLGGGPLGGEGRMFVAKLDAAGDHLWSKQLWTSPDGTGFPHEVALDADDGMLLLGTMQGTIDLGGGMLGGGGDGYRPFLGKLDATGTFLWARAFPAVDAKVNGLAVAPSGDVVITGIHEDALDLGGGVLGDGSNDAPAMFVGRYDAAGNYLYGASYGGGEDPTYAVGTSAVMDGAGDVTITGAARGFVDFGAGYVQSDDHQLHVTTFDPAGQLTFSSRYGLSGASVCLSVARGPDGHVVVAGYTEGSIDFGVGPHVTAGGKDLVVAKMAY
jgi:hypothetical protein